MKLNITVEGKLYEVDVEVAEPEPSPIHFAQPERQTAPTPTPAVKPKETGGGEPVDDEKKVCRSPLAGLVSEVKVVSGEEVMADKELFVLEAMKMFATITSPVAGKVKVVRVEKASIVKQGQVLIEFE